MEKTASVWLLAGFWVACGGDGGPSSFSPTSSPSSASGRGNSGVATDTKVTALTDDNAKRFCAWLDELDASLNVTDEQACTFDAWVDAETTGDCVAQRDACLDDLEEEATTDDEDRDSDYCANVTAADLDVSSDCSDVTVGQVESCLRDLADVYESAASMATCDDPDSVADQDLPESCRGGKVVNCVPDT